MLTNNDVALDDLVEGLLQLWRKNNTRSVFIGNLTRLFVWSQLTLGPLFLAVYLAHDGFADSPVLFLLTWMLASLPAIFIIRKSRRFIRRLSSGQFQPIPDRFSHILEDTLKDLTFKLNISRSSLVVLIDHRDFSISASSSKHRDRIYLLLSLGYFKLWSMDREAAIAILAHEMGHFCQRDTDLLLLAKVYSTSLLSITPIFIALQAFSIPISALALTTGQALERQDKEIFDLAGATAGFKMDAQGNITPPDMEAGRYFLDARNVYEQQRNQDGSLQASNPLNSAIFGAVNILATLLVFKWIRWRSERGADLTASLLTSRSDLERALSKVDVKRVRFFDPPVEWRIDRLDTLLGMYEVGSGPLWIPSEKLTDLTKSRRAKSDSRPNEVRRRLGGWLLVLFAHLVIFSGRCCLLLYPVFKALVKVWLIAGFSRVAISHVFYVFARNGIGIAFVMNLIVLFLAMGGLISLLLVRSVALSWLLAHFISLPIWIISLGWEYKALAGGASADISLYDAFLTTSVLSILWLFYLWKSRRVKMTFGRNIRLPWMNGQRKIWST